MYLKKISLITSTLIALQAAATPAQAGLIVDGGFRSAPNGFKFQNHGNTLYGTPDAEGNRSQTPVTNLTTAEMIRFFGNQVCASGSGESCILTPPAKQWMEAQNHGHDGGHCSGYSIMTALVYAGKVKPSDFGANNINELKLEGNTLLQREIAYWASTQSLLPGGGMRPINSDFDFVFDSLINELKKPVAADRALYEIGFQKRDKSGGHSVLPYAIDDLGGNKFNILIYDNNYPGQEMKIAVDRTAKTWKYTTAHDPSLPASDYDGDAESRTLFVRNVAARLDPQQCPFCPAPPEINQQLAAPTLANLKSLSNSTKNHEISTYGDAIDLLITDADGKRLGVVNTNGVISNVNEVTGTNQLIRTTNLNDDLSPIYQMPYAKPYTVTIDGTHVTQTVMTDLSVFGPGYFLAVEQIYIDKLQTDTVTISANDTRQSYTMTYRTTSNETPILAIGITNAGADYELRATLESDASGQAMQMNLDNISGKVALRALSNKAEKFSLHISRIDAAGEIEFSKESIEIPANATLYLHYGNWSAKGQALTSTLDLNSDGTVDQTLALKQITSVYMPIVINKQ